MHGEYTRFLKDISGVIDFGAIAEKYDLSYDETMAAIERSISSTLSDIFRSDVECLLTARGCEFYVYRENGVDIFPAERMKKNILRAIKYNFISALHNKVVARGYEKLRYLAGEITDGHIAAVFDDRIFVQLDGRAGPACSGMIGVCEREHQPPKERGLYRAGDYYNSFYVSSVTPSTNGRIPVLKISLSRTSRSLTEGLLRKRLAERLLDMRVQCIKRAAGIFSLVEAEGRIPRECIKAVSDELKERIIVRLVRKK